MPRGDGTGPAGAGSMTGRAAGYCAGYNTPGFANPIPGRGLGFGRGRGGLGFGRGRGFGRGWGGFGYAPSAYNGPYPAAYPQPTAQQEADALKNEAQYLKDALEDVNKRISELDKDS